MVADLSFIEYCVDLFYKIKLSNFIVFLYKDIEREVDELSFKDYKFDSEKQLFVPDKDKLEQRESAMKLELADIVVDITSKTIDEIVDEIVDKIKNYYSVN